MKINRTVNATRNITWGIASQIILVGFPFIVRAATIHSLGAEYLGINSLFQSVLQVLSISELGVSSTITYSMYQPIAEDDTDTICALLNFYRKVYIGIGLLILTSGLLICPFIPKIISGTVPDGVNIYLVFLVYLGNSVIGYFFFSYKQSLLNAYQRTDILSINQILTRIFMYSCQIFVLLKFKNYYTYLFFVPLTTLIQNFANSALVDRMFPQYVCRGEISTGLLHKIRLSIPGLVINKLCFISRNSFDNIFISAYLGLTVSAIYANYYYILSSLSSFLGIISSSILAGIGNSIVIESSETNYQMMKKINFIYMWLAGWCAICLLCLYQPFMRIWVGDELCFDFKTVILFVLYFYLLKMGDIRGTYSEAAGLWWENRYRAILESVVNLILNYTLVRFLGIYGIILATLLSLFFINFLWGSNIVFKFYFKNGKASEYFLLHGKYALCTGCIAAVTYMVCSLKTYGLYGDFLVRGVICVILPNLIYYLVYRKTSEFKIAVPWILNKVLRKKDQ